MTANGGLIRTTCSGCGRDTTVDPFTGDVSVKVESNGVRGSGHVGAHTIMVSGMVTEDLFLFTWDCPMCEYADSVELP